MSGQNGGSNSLTEKVTVYYIIYSYCLLYHILLTHVEISLILVYNGMPKFSLVYKKYSF